MIIFNLILFLFFVNRICIADANCNNKSNGFYPDIKDENCNSYYYCFNGNVNKTLQCHDQSKPIFSAYRQTCVEKSSIYNECYLKTIMEDNENCAWFYFELSTQPNLTLHHSCPYPFLFEIKTKQCKHYSEVKCHQRFEAKDECDYRNRHQRTPAHVVPCWLTPSCRKKSDGLHGFQLKECSEYYECKDERLIDSKYCPPRMRFSDKKKMCLSTITSCDLK